MKKYNPATAREPEQLNRMLDLESRGVCAFCREHIETEMTEPIELETEHWVVKRNDFPYERTKLHLLLIPKLHVKTISELSIAARQDFIGVIVTCESHYKLKHYALGMRSGDMRFTGGSVEHLHAHIIVGDVKDPAHEPVRFKMSSLPGKKL